MQNSGSRKAETPDVTRDKKAGWFIKKRPNIYFLAEIYLNFKSRYLDMATAEEKEDRKKLLAGFGLSEEQLDSLSDYPFVDHLEKDWKQFIKALDVFREELVGEGKVWVNERAFKLFKNALSSKRKVVDMEKIEGVQEKSEDLESSSHHSFDLEGIAEMVHEHHPDWKVGSFQKFPGGKAAGAYLVRLTAPQKELVLKKVESWRVAKAQYCYDLIKNRTAIPVPEVIYANPSKGLLLLEKVGDGNLFEERSRISANRLKELFHEFGQKVAELHSIKFDKSGYLLPEGVSGRVDSYSKPKKRWADFITSTSLRRLKRVERFFPKRLPKMKGLLKKEGHLLDCDFQPCFVHDDLNGENFMISDSQFVGLVDMDRCLAGHNEYDLHFARFWLCNPARLGMNREELFEIFLKGYRTKNTLSKDYKDRERVYTIAHIIRTISGPHNLNPAFPKERNERFVKEWQGYIDAALQTD